ncbi:hypothetical protein PROFUN_13562 [Planoprotostelium fungivorum]|uniref:Uncharacterized protein n=1 Tax=Planoprotostelium fungivorum TaxID=1890364 RepID=A0A2P6N3F3_9EUKA|nr:hypothetical protein PROFUN_13562 [Planoprotostelium fungivorum]
MLEETKGDFQQKQNQQYQIGLEWCITGNTIIGNSISNRVFRDNIRWGYLEAMFISQNNFQVIVPLVYSPFRLSFLPFELDYDLVKTFPVKRTEPKAFDELPVSKLLNYLTRDNIIELIGFPNFSSLNEQVRQQTGKVSLPAVKKTLADNEQFQAILDQNHGMMQQAYNKYLAANTKANDLTRQQQSKQVKLQRIQNTKIRGKKCELNEESENLKGLFERELTTYNNKKQCMKMNNKRYEERLQELLEEKEKESAAEIKKVQVECTSKTIMSLELQLEESCASYKTLEQRDKFITKQMIPLRKHEAHDIACFTFQVQPADKRCATAFQILKADDRATVVIRCLEELHLFENSATKKHIQCMFIEKEHLGFLWFEIILYKQRLIELFGSYVVTIHRITMSKACELLSDILVDESTQSEFWMTVDRVGTMGGTSEATLRTSDQYH